MERTVALVIFFAFAVIGAGLIILFVSGAKESIAGICSNDPACDSRTNGEAFCEEGALSRCVLKDGCLVKQTQACACTVTDGFAHCP